MTTEIYSFAADVNVNLDKKECLSEYSTVLDVNPEINYKLIMHFQTYKLFVYDYYYKLNVEVKLKTNDDTCKTIIHYTNYIRYNYNYGESPMSFIIDHIRELKTMDFSKNDDPIGLIALKIYQLYTPKSKVLELPHKNIHKLDMIRKSYADLKEKYQENKIKAEKAFEEMQNKIQEHDSEIAKLKESLTSMQSQIQQSIQSQQIEQTDKLEIVKSKQTNKSGIVKSKKTNESRNAKLTKDLENANNKILKLTSDLKNANDQIIGFLDDFETMHLKIIKTKKENEMLNNKIAENKIEKQQIIELMYKLNIDIENFKTEKNNEIKKLNQQIINQQQTDQTTTS